MNWLQPWGSHIAIALLAGLINLPITIKKLLNKCEALPFFKPLRTIAFLWWILVNLALPAIVFWLFYSLSNKPAVDRDLVMKAITFGLIFTALANARVDTGFTGINIEKIYNYLTQFTYDRIAASQTRETAAFWTDFENDLNQYQPDVSEGLNYLENYFLGDVSLDEAAKQEYQTRIDRARQISDRVEQIKSIRNLIVIRRRDLPEALKRFKCSSAFLDEYLPKLPKQ
jgi:hypothetical protein